MTPSEIEMKRIMVHARDFLESANNEHCHYAVKLIEDALSELDALQQDRVFSVDSDVLHGVFGS